MVPTWVRKIHINAFIRTCHVITLSKFNLTFIYAQPNYCPTLDDLLFLAYPTGISVTPTGARKCCLTWGGLRQLSCMTSVWQFWRHFHVKFRKMFWRQRIREEPNLIFLDKKKCSYVSEKLIKQQISSLLLMRGLLEGGFSHITTLWITLIQILSYHNLAFL